MRKRLVTTASERRGNNSRRYKDFLTESQGQNLALTVLHVLYSLDKSGMQTEACDTRST